MPSVETPVNVFKNQLFIGIGEVPSYQFKIIFPEYRMQIMEKKLFPMYGTKNKENNKIVLNL